ncbi:DNA-binding MarR family transcriptional regulator [Streptomyces zagrosensis]|uniref:DNA-binding MarR family transcriptional regulator n=1 Tax=Streptomyces zagrosensis TaxID=1042984 RepID=A0A7W9Q620_9ACTN|nr:DNA-binding MarR family transcriptional regulator [Streptomyces zagrosensis]
MEDSDGCRATDLAAHYLLHTSTVSRQISALEQLGYVERRTDPGDHRVRVLHLTASGTEALRGVTANRRALMHRRLTTWDAADLDRFAAYLRRYNATGGQPQPHRPHPMTSRATTS